MRIDAHQHFWRYSAAEYPWMQPEWPIRRDFGPEELAPELRACGLDGCIAVQARQSLEETRWLLELAAGSPLIKGVVGWVDLCAPEAGEQLAHFAAQPKFVGVRHVVQDEPAGFLARADFRRGLARLADFNLTYDLLIYPHQLAEATDLVRAFPAQPFVLDHLAKPLIREGALSPWRERLQELATAPNVVAKISGLVAEARWQAWQPADFQPYLAAALAAFGPERLLYGSDWPVALLAASYAQVYELVHDFTAPLGAEAEAEIFGENAARFYHL